MNKATSILLDLYNSAERRGGLGNDLVCGHGPCIDPRPSLVVERREEIEQYLADEDR